MMNADRLLEYNYIMLALLGTLFTWGGTALGASLVFFFNTINKRILNLMLGFAAGVMIAASFWSLLNPAIEMEEAKNPSTAWIPAVVGFLSGGAFLYLIDKLLPHVHSRFAIGKSEGIKTSWDRSVLLILAITLHNIPEGLAIGVSFGALAIHPDPAVLAGAIVLTVGIGLQNFPEGAAVSIPLRQESFFVRATVGGSRANCRSFGCISGDCCNSFTALCSFVRCRCDDICGGRRFDT
jgi:ZIP family zinc transporter